MKTNFESEEDQASLRKIIDRAIMDTERVIFSEHYFQKCPEYTKLVLELREKCFEFLEEPDPNEHILGQMHKALDEAIKKEGLD